MAGCIANPINDRTREHYYEAAQKAEAAGDFETAQRDYGRAQINAQIGNLGPVKEAYACYEWSRMTGYLGRYAEAEKGYNDALALIDKANGQADNLRAPLLCEYARMLHDSGQEQKAEPIYARALAELKRVDIELQDPLGYADFLDDYAQTLRDIGSKGRADGMAALSTAIRKSHKGEHSRFSSVEDYAAAGRAAQNRNDWASARIYWARAVAFGELSQVPPAQLAPLYYEYGRSLGVGCDFSGAEVYLQKALKLDKENQGDDFMDLTELARLNYDQHKFSEAAAYYKQDIAVLDRKNAEVDAPAAFVDILTEYADCLRKTSREDEARKVEERVVGIKAKNSELHSTTERTPYGKYPSKQS